MPEEPRRQDTDKLRRSRFQFSLRFLLLLVLLTSLYFAHFAHQRRKAERRRQAYATIEGSYPYTTGGASGPWPWHSNWLHRLLGDQQRQELHFVVFSNFSEVDDDTLAALAEFQELSQLWLNGDVHITDAGLDRLKGLKQLRDLDLADSAVTPAAVDALRRALPNCKITWEGEGPTRASR